MLDNHRRNLGRIVGHDVSGRYSYIVSQDELIDTYMKMRNDLGYPLMVDSKYRRAIVYNKKGLEKQIEKMIDDCLLSNIGELQRLMLEDIGERVTDVLNCIKQSADGTYKLNNVKAKSLFVSSMAKGLLKGIVNIIEDMNNQGDN